MNAKLPKVTVNHSLVRTVVAYRDARAEALRAKRDPAVSVRAYLQALIAALEARRAWLCERIDEQRYARVGGWNDPVDIALHRQRAETLSRYRKLLAPLYPQAQTIAHVSRVSQCFCGCGEPQTVGCQRRSALERGAL